MKHGSPYILPQNRIHRLSAAEERECSAFASVSPFDYFDSSELFGIVKTERGAADGEECTVVRGRRIVGAFVEVAANLALLDRELAAVERRYQALRDKELSVPAFSVRVNSRAHARSLGGQLLYKYASVSLGSELRQICAVRIYLEVYVLAATLDGRYENLETAVGIYRIVAPSVSRQHGAFRALEKGTEALVFYRAEPHGAFGARISVFFPVEGAYLEPGDKLLLR